MNCERKAKAFMKILLKNVTIIDPRGAFHLQEVDIFILDGYIAKIGEKLAETADQIIHKENLHLSIGWFDSSVCFGEPGYEERETIENGLQTAGKSGFTDIALAPETSPTVDHQAAVVQLKHHGCSLPTRIHPIAAFTKGQKGKTMTELYDLQSKGAIAFGDFLRPIENPELLKIGLQYAQGFDGLILSTPFESRIGGHGVVHEGIVSTQLGLTGIPALSESIHLQRDIHLLRYTGGKLHIPCISSAASVGLIREAKKEGLNISCSVPLANLCYTEEALFGFDTNTKLFPPLRTKSDQEALKEGLLDGTIDLVTSHHQPFNIELKHLEFEHAAFGTIGLEAVFSVLNTIFPLEKVVQLLSQGRSIFGLDTPTIAVGEKACFSLFNPNGSGNFSSKDLLSSNKNCIFLGHSTQGEVYGSLLGEEFILK